MKKIIKLSLTLLFFLLVWLGGYFWNGSREFTVIGELAVPMYQDDMFGRWEILIKSDTKILASFKVPDGEIINIIDSQKDLVPEMGISTVKVVYHKNLWNQVVNPEVHVMTPGWIYRP